MPGGTGGAVDAADMGREWDMLSVRGGVGALSSDALPVLSLFCAAYAHLLTVMDDQEFHGRQVGRTGTAGVDLGFRVLGLGLRVKGSGIRMWGAGFWILGLGFRV